MKTILVFVAFGGSKQQHDYAEETDVEQNPKIRHPIVFNRRNAHARTFGVTDANSSRALGEPHRFSWVKQADIRGVRKARRNKYSDNLTVLLRTDC